ncbi:hypothetical protein [Fodinibius halophilus]|uniref:Lipoprotein n=1 Tax=Fodinibius halophilus TaxID=1736908 RepID=A0A6M1T9T4_9BACT|nr:hypothetical protein [Fodinibius halophilus]NGP90255.1 hypothetical protein [Fodinibius halophilus]
MKPIPNFAILFIAFSVLASSCSVFSPEKEDPTIQFFSSSQSELLTEGSIQVEVPENHQEITLTDSQSKSQRFTVTPDTFSFEFSFFKHDTEELISQGDAKLNVEQDKNYTISFDPFKVDTSSEGSISYGGCFDCLKFTSFSINYSALDSTSSLYNHRLLITFFD